MRKYVICFCETGNKSGSDKFLMKYESTVAGYFYPIQSLRAFLWRNCGTPFEKQRLTLTIIKGVTLERTSLMVYGIVFG